MPDKPEILPDVPHPDEIVLIGPINEDEEEEDESEESRVSRAVHEPRPETRPPVTGCSMPM
jgi:hypothetical protein